METSTTFKITKNQMTQIGKNADIPIMISVGYKFLLNVAKIEGLLFAILTKLD